MKSSARLLPLGLIVGTLFAALTAQAQAPSTNDQRTAAAIAAAAEVAAGAANTAAAAATTANEAATATAQQAELIQKLLQRIDQLEKKEAEQAEAARKAQTEVVQKLEAHISELQTKVGTLETDKALAELAAATNTGPTVTSLDQELRVIERNNEIAAEAAEAKAKEAPKITIGDRGFGFASANGDFSLQLKGLLQVDSRTYFDDADIPNNDGFLIRRARPILAGTLYRDFDFLFVPDFAPSTPTIFDAYINYRYQPWLQLRAGKFKSPVGLEQLQADVNTLFNERSLVTDLVPNRDIGYQLWGEVLDGALTYQAAMLNGVGDGRNATGVNFSGEPEFVGRLFVQPFKPTEWTPLQGLGFGVGGSYGNISSNSTGLPATTGGTLPGYATVGQQQFFAYNPNPLQGGAVVADGIHWRVSPQAYYYYGPLGLMAEYAISSQDVTRSATLLVPASSTNVQNTAWQVAASWVLTGEDASFNGVVPRRPFSIANGQWGALQIVGRYTALDIDDSAFPVFSDPTLSASSARGWSAGVNWYLNRNLRFNASFSHTTFTGGGGIGFGPLDPRGQTPPATVSRQPEQVFFTRMQLAF
jgi:phosphate-selective porin OprO/OprP